MGGTGQLHLRLEPTEGQSVTAVECVAIEVSQAPDGTYFARCVYSPSGGAGPWMRLPVTPDTPPSEVTAGLRQWNEAVVIRHVDSGPPAGDDAFLWT